jgi:hypothetical protein
MVTGTPRSSSPSRGGSGEAAERRLERRPVGEGVDDAQASSADRRQGLA